jgi:hypothetical protein
MPTPVVDAITTHLDPEVSIGRYEAEFEPTAKIGVANEHTTASFAAAMKKFREPRVGRARTRSQIAA